MVVRCEPLGKEQGGSKPGAIHGHCRPLRGAPGLEFPLFPGSEFVLQFRGMRIAPCPLRYGGNRHEDLPAYQELGMLVYEKEKAAPELTHKEIMEGE